MNITSCPRCGGRVRSVSIGWKCESCQEFIDMRGEFHQHKEEPFMPPMTNADRIRAMSDEDLAWELMVWRCDAAARYHGIESVYPDTQQTVLKWLQQPAEEEP